AADWCRENAPAHMHFEIHRLPGRTPLLFMEIPGTTPPTADAPCVLLYGHLDKQPEFEGWHEGLAPWEPVIRDGRLYGRGGADDGYAVFASLTAIRALQEQKVPHARCVVMIELCEESGSFDLPHHFETLAERIGTPDLVICLDAECGNYEQFWCTTSLRGNLVGTLSVEVLTEGVHSGAAGGIVPSSFRILRNLLDRVEDSATGTIKLAAFSVDVPNQRLEQARRSAEALGETSWRRFPFVEGAGPASRDPFNLLLANTWRACVEVTGAAGMPAPAAAGNVLRPRTEIKLSFRLPPTADPGTAAAQAKEVLEDDPPMGTKVRFRVDSAMGGWDAPPLAKWLEKAIREASQQHFGKEASYLGTGGSIPFMGMLGERFPEAQFLVTGLLGPQSNAHGPNEFLHIATGKKLTACVADVLAAHAARDRSKSGKN
ncbi:MAG TPA: M20/M25/M40 family metallo-hydrolase, partial [Gammaproteobacteria bacterium]|nr:M20/M25/M40 family metallo-hydrolase [Gammaproteobacteria bacterium]